MAAAVAQVCPRGRGGRRRHRPRIRRARVRLCAFPVACQLRGGACAQLDVRRRDSRRRDWAFAAVSLALACRDRERGVASAAERRGRGARAPHPRHIAQRLGRPHVARLPLTDASRHARTRLECVVCAVRCSLGRRAARQWLLGALTALLGQRRLDPLGGRTQRQRLCHAWRSRVRRRCGTAGVPGRRATARGHRCSRLCARARRRGVGASWLACARLRRRRGNRLRRPFFARGRSCSSSGCPDDGCSQRLDVAATRSAAFIDAAERACGAA